MGSSATTPVNDDYEYDMDEYEYEQMKRYTRKGCETDHKSLWAEALPLHMYPTPSINSSTGYEADQDEPTSYHTDTDTDTELGNWDLSPIPIPIASPKNIDISTTQQQQQQQQNNNIGIENDTEYKILI